MQTDREKVAVIYGSKSDWPIMQEACSILDNFSIGYISKVVSAHRTPKLMFEFATQAKAKGLKVIIAGAGGAAHLPGMTASSTILPVIGVPIPSENLKGMDSLLSICQMPKGIPVATMAIGKAGAINAALLAISILALDEPDLSKKLISYRANNNGL